MMNEESVFTLFNLYFIPFPRQVFVGIFHVVFPTKDNASGIIIFMEPIHHIADRD